MSLRQTTHKPKARENSAQHIRRLIITNFISEKSGFKDDQTKIRLFLDFDIAQSDVDISPCCKSVEIKLLINVSGYLRHSGCIELRFILK